MHMQMGDPSKDGRNVEGRRMLVVDVGVGWVLRNGCVCAVCWWEMCDARDRRKGRRGRGGRRVRAHLATVGRFTFKG